LEDRSSSFLGAAEIVSIKHVGKGKRRPFRITFAGIARIGGCGGPDEVAAVMEFLLSDDASFATSSLYTADGGTMWL
jgi:hypothetical protein